MPSRNVLKIDIDSSFYHVYGRGNNKQRIFHDDQDYRTFLELFRRHLSAQQKYDKHGHAYPFLTPKIELVCYCLMPNHFHLLVFQKEAGGMTRLMQSILTGYSRYFNNKYGRSGSLLESRYKAARVSYHSYLEHITRYIHLNPRQWRRYKYSSLPFYLGEREAEWLKPRRILSLFASRQAYLAFLQDYDDHKQMLSSLEFELANIL